MEFNPTGNSPHIQSHRREKYFVESFTLIEIKDGKGREVIDIRCYSTAALQTVVVWVRHPHHVTGTGKDQYYRKDAVLKALIHAGFKGLKDGESPEGHLTTIAEFLQIPNYYIHNAHA